MPNNLQTHINRYHNCCYTRSVGHIAIGFEEIHAVLQVFPSTIQTIPLQTLPSSYCQNLATWLCPIHAQRGLLTKAINEMVVDQAILAVSKKGMYFMVIQINNLYSNFFASSMALQSQWKTQSNFGSCKGFGPKGQLAK
jgi:hypothetical protein